tara:strand:- start:9589 stop:10845 length:1257 start_codon:yes stop_codon:yes gene_type:complete
MKKNLLIGIWIIFYGLVWTQNTELITQKVNLENAIVGKVNATMIKFLDPSQYIIHVNAHLDFKPLSFNSSTKSGQGSADYESSTYTFIPGLDMPSIPTDQTIFKPSSKSGLSGFKYSSSLLYGLEIIIYLDESITTGSLQQNLKTLIQNNIPEIIDCQDCIQFKTLDILGGEGVAGGTVKSKIQELEDERRKAEQELQNWRFNQLEEQLSIAEDARSEWEAQARNRERLRRIDDSTRMKNLESIEKAYKTKQDSLYVLTSIKLDEAVRGRIESEENTKKELLNLIKLQIQGEEIGDNEISAETGAGLYGKRPIGSKGAFSAQTWLMVLAVLILLTILLILIMKNKQPVYLKPRVNNEVNDNNTTVQPTQANTNEEVLRSELQSLRQSAVSMSVSEKAGANQIVKDWLEDKSDDSGDNE